jgi:hypothetical protein
MKRVTLLLWLLAAAECVHAEEVKRSNFDAPAYAPAYAGAIPAPESRAPKFVQSRWTGEQLLAALAKLKPGHWPEVPGSELARVQVDACKSAAINLRPRHFHAPPKRTA